MIHKKNRIGSAISGCILMVVLLYGCIKDAPLNPEADIETFEIDRSQLTGNVFIDQINRTITLNLTKDAFEKGVRPTITVSAGATVQPASGTAITFDGEGVVYEVTSASGQNKKQYTVKVLHVGKWDFNFETWLRHATDGYEYPVEEDDVQLWSSGNPGVALSGVAKRPDAYPTRSGEGLQGTRGAELVTIKGTFLSELIGIRLFAGSLFLGDFNPAQALQNPLAATEFGQPYVGLPDRFTGYYHYTSGSEFINREGQVQAGVKDKCDIYAVLFNGPDRLNATNIMTSDKVIARAQLPDGSDRASFTKFDIPFVYEPGVVIGENLMMAIVASSSAEGNQYRGAVGSKLVVDSLRIVPKL
ncbi:PCMD domain-containing protein [Sphingobacterium suaedae]|uniref:PCMD domain-containing protein n=1 Tax=Sphingobacterium suaedae TaxID=1686402 RepID=A0ABW5KK37_9SPHI